MKKQLLLPLVSILAAALVLFGLSVGLNGVATANAQAEHHRLLETLMPGSSAFVVEPYTGEDANIVSVHKGDTGYVIETNTYGYAGEIEMMIGVTNEGTVKGLVIKEMHETRGLGANALTDWEFLAQFLKGEGDAEIGTNVDAISGATVTSKAIARSVNSAVSYVTGTDVDSGATSWGG